MSQTKYEAKAIQKLYNHVQEVNTKESHMRRSMYTNLGKNNRFWDLVKISDFHQLLMLWSILAASKWYLQEVKEHEI